MGAVSVASVDYAFQGPADAAAAGPRRLAKRADRTIPRLLNHEWEV